MSAGAQPPRRVRKAYPILFGNKKDSNRASLERSQSLRTEGRPTVVKGISKRVIVVKSPDPRIFEQAIFIVREDFVGERGLTDRDILRQARQTVNGYALEKSRSRPGAVSRLRGGLYAAAGAAAAALAWAAVHLTGILG